MSELSHKQVRILIQQNHMGQTERKALAAHLAHCEACQDYAKVHIYLARNLHLEAVSTQPSPERKAAILKLVQRRHRRNLIMTPVRAVAAVAAFTGIVIFAWFILKPTSEQSAASAPQAVFSEEIMPTSPAQPTQVQEVEPAVPAEGNESGTASLPADQSRVYGQWQTEGHQFFPHFDVWEFREDGTLLLSSQDSSDEATGVFFFNCDYANLTDEQLATVPHYYAKGIEGGPVVFSDHCQSWIDNPDQSRGFLEGEQFFSFAYQVNPPEYDSSIDSSHPVMIISFPDTDDTMAVHIAGIGSEIIMFLYEEPMVFERLE